MQILVTGGAGFIGSALVQHLLVNTDHQIVNVDALTYAAYRPILMEFARHERYAFEQANICNRESMERIFSRYQPGLVIHLAAETHVDNSIRGPEAFTLTNVLGTQTLLETVRHYWEGLPTDKRAEFRFLQVSTDEVYGDLGVGEGLFTETSPYQPSSPYSASKAAADHMVRAWGRTYGLPVLITCCSNNYGPRQHREKLIPLMIENALAGNPLPVYGDGQQIRDWLYVDDHARALLKVAEQGGPGETYNIGATNEHCNLVMVEMLCDLLEEFVPKKPDGVSNYRDLITFVEDRPGHDLRYGVATDKIRTQLGWMPETDFESGLRRTVSWYLENIQRGGR